LPNVELISEEMRYVGLVPKDSSFATLDRPHQNHLVFFTSTVGGLFPFFRSMQIGKTKSPIQQCVKKTKRMRAKFVSEMCERWHAKIHEHSGTVTTEE
jgi:hypothetical protein